MSGNTSKRLTSLYSEDETVALRKISQAMLADPSIFDTHSREKRHGQEDRCSSKARTCEEERG